MRTDNPETVAALLAGGLDTSRTRDSINSGGSSVFFSRAGSTILSQNREVKVAVLLKRLPIKVVKYLERRVDAVTDARRRRLASAPLLNGDGNDAQEGEEFGQIVTEETEASLGAHGVPRIDLQEDSMQEGSADASAEPELSGASAASDDFTADRGVVAPTEEPTEPEDVPLPEKCAQYLLQQKIGFAGLASEVMSGVFMELMQDLLLDEAST
ncbi:MAG: hypothetical protein B7Z06_04060 [Flavobacteriales bacterium 32-35-8]|nr:MAG: hypothetical protein B7Z06_04060 [Flavobacteriales bacterium 32-35-8]